MLINTPNYLKNTSLFDWQNHVASFPPWLPTSLNHEEWPPNYAGVFAWRNEILETIERDPSIISDMLDYYSDKPAEFIMHWIDTYDPRRTDAKWIPFVFFKRQDDFITFLHDLRNSQESGLSEKCRDAGATWCACAYSIWSFLFIQDDSIGWGSRKEQLVDKIGDPDSIFEKLRLILRRIPGFFLPKSFAWKKHATYMKLINPDSGATITGEAGNNIGRGGRKSMYFVDEAAHLEQPELVEAALGDNTNVRVDISSVNGLGNPFHNRREAGIEWSKGQLIPPGFVRVFVIDWRDHPAKTQEWYDQRRAKYEREGMLHIFAQEVERNYSAALDNTVIPYEWIEAAVDAHFKMRWIDSSGKEQIGVPAEMFEVDPIAGLDVADEGGDRNALSLRRFILLRHVDEWGERDVAATARRALAAMKFFKSGIVYYDSIGVGAGVKAEYNNLIDEKIIEFGKYPFIAWNAGAAVQNPYYRIIPDDDDSATNGEFFENMKAQAWWSIRTRFYKTFKNITEGQIYPLEDMISLDSRLQKLASLKKELAQPTYTHSKHMRVMIEKKPDGTKSPNLADSTVMAYFPIEDAQFALIGRYGQ